MSDTVNIICCSGGGTLGAFQGGAIQALTDQQIEIHGLAGTSTGAVQAGFISGVASGLDTQKQRVSDLQKYWFSLKSSKDIMDTSKIHGVLRILTFKPNFSNLDPLRKMIQPLLDAPQRPLVLASCGLNSSIVDYLRPKTTEELLEAIISSASVPLLFPPQGKNGYVDGGVRDMAPLSGAFQLARELAPVSSDRKARIFLINPTIWSFAYDVDNVDWSKKPVWNVAQRIASMMEQETLQNDISTAVGMNNLLSYFVEKGCPRPTWLADKVIADVITINPTYTPYGSFDVVPDKIQEYWKHGYDQAKKALNG